MQETLAHQEVLRNSLLIISMILLATLAVSRLVYPKLFSYVYGFEKLLIFKYREDFGSGIRLLSTESFFFTSLLSAILSFVFICISSQLDNQILVNNHFLSLGSFWLTLGTWLIVSLFILFLFFLKFLFVRFFGWLFALPYTITRHFQEFQNFNNLIAIVLFSITLAGLYWQFKFPTGLDEFLMVLIAIYLFFRLINLFFKIRSLRACSNLYIFSYLCSTELIPTFLVLKFLV